MREVSGRAAPDADARPCAAATPTPRRNCTQLPGTATSGHTHEQVSEDTAEKAMKIESLNLKKPAEDVEAKLHEEKECADNDQDVG